MELFLPSQTQQELCWQAQEHLLSFESVAALSLSNVSNISLVIIQKHRKKKRSELNFLKKATILNHSKNNKAHLLKLK